MRSPDAPGCMSAVDVVANTPIATVWNTATCRHHYGVEINTSFISKNKRLAL